MKKNKQFKAETIIDETGKALFLIINGKKYKRKKHETNQELFLRVGLNKRNKADVAKYYKPEELIVYTQETYNKIMQKEKPKKLSNKTKASPSLKQRVGAVTVAAVMMLSAYIGPNLAKAYKDSKVYATKTEQDAKVSNQKLNKLYEKLKKTENGETIVKQLKETDKFQKDFNKRMQNYPDENGNVLFLKAREVAAVQDISNAEDTDFISLDDNEPRVCDYLEAATYTTIGLYVSEESTGEHTLIHDKETSQEMKKEADYAIATMKGNTKTEEINNHYAKFNKTGFTYGAVGSNVAFLGYASNAVISQNGAASDELEKITTTATKDNKGLNNQNSHANAASKSATPDQKRLINKVLKELDKNNINVNIKSRDDFSMETTEKGKKVKEQITINADGTYSYTEDNRTNTITYRISREEAIKRFGLKIVKEAEKEADKKAGIDEKNKQEEQQGQELEKQATAAYNAGRDDALAGKPNQYPNNQSYCRGYNETKETMNEQKEEIIEDKTNTDTTYEDYQNTETESYEEQTMEFEDDDYKYTSTAKIRVRS